MTRGRRTAIILILVIIVAGVIFVGYRVFSATESKKAAAAEGKVAALPVEVSTPYRGDIDNTVIRNGDIMSRSTVQVISKVPGKIVSIPIALGSKVGMGSTIAVIDRDEPGFEFTRFRIEAPISGEVAQLPVSVGQYVMPGTPVAVLIKPGDIKVVANLTDKDLAYVGVGHEVQVDYKDPVEGLKTYTATVSHIAPAANPANRTWQVELKPQGGSTNMFAGSYVSVHITIEKRTGVLLLPRTCMTVKGGNNVVYLLDGDRAKEREIKLGLSNEKTVEVIEGLSETDKVIVIQGINVQDGDLVKQVESQK